jgi:hypothetical protein
MHTDLKAATAPDAGLDDERMTTYVVTDETDPDDLLGRVVDYFGADRERRNVRLLFGEEARYLERTTVYAFLATSSKGLGQGGYGLLPGYSAPHQAREYEFQCPIDGCPDSPVFVLAFDEPPTCRLHHTALELVS